jgi:hypothetical protein
MEGLRADVARLTLCVVGAFLDGSRDGLRVLRICVVLLCAACFFNFFAELVVATLLPVLLLALRTAVACAAAAAFLAQGKPKLGGADGALREDHLVYGQIARGQPTNKSDGCDLKASRLLVSYMPLANRGTGLRIRRSRPQVHYTCKQHKQSTQPLIDNDL